MFTPEYRVVVTKNCFPSDNVICLGVQLISIIEFLKEFTPCHVWFCADVDATGENINQFNINACQLGLIGDSDQLIQYCLGINQFICGVFVCIDNSYSVQNIQNIELKTEDTEFRNIACEGVFLEIRTFDTSFFEIYSENLTIMNKLSKKFKLEKVDYKSLSSEAE